MIVSDTQTVTLRTAKGVQLDQFGPGDQIGLTWSRELRETSHCDLQVIAPSVSIPDIVPWLHWLDVWDDEGIDLLWTGPVTKFTGNRQQVSISAMDLSTLASRTRNPLTKKWDATDPADIAGEFYAAMIDHHGLNARAIIRTDPLGDPFDFSSVSEQAGVDAIIDQLATLGLYWTIVSGVPILGPWDRAPLAALGEDDFIGDGIAITRDGTNSYNDILLRAADNLAYAKVPMGGLALQQTVTIDDMFGVSNADKAVRQYASHVAAIHDTVAIPDNSTLHPDAPVTIAQLIPSARVTLDAYGMNFLMQISGVEVSSKGGGSATSVTLQAVDDDLPELVELQDRKSLRGVT